MAVFDNPCSLLLGGWSMLEVKIPTWEPGRGTCEKSLSISDELVIGCKRRGFIK